MRKPCYYIETKDSVSCVVSLLAILRGWQRIELFVHFSVTYSFFFKFPIMKIGNWVYVQKGKKILLYNSITMSCHHHANNLSKTVPHWLLDMHLFVIFYLQRCIRVRGLGLPQKIETGSQNILSSRILNLSHIYYPLDYLFIYLNFC